MSYDRREEFYHTRIKEAGPQYPGFDLRSTEILLSLRYTEDVLQQACAGFFCKYGMSKSSVNILMLLRHGPEEGMQLHDLGELLLVSRANITGLIDHLEEKGYVVRVVDPSDKRARLARITAKGTEFLNSFMPVHYRNVKAMLHALSVEEKTALLALLKKTRASLAAYTKQMEQTAGTELIDAPAKG